MNDPEKQTILDEIAALTAVPEREEEDFTTAEYAQRMDVSEPTARRRLELLVEEGVLATVMVRINQRRVRVYRRAVKQWQTHGIQCWPGYNNPRRQNANTRASL